MRNPFKKFIKIMDKSDKVIVTAYEGEDGTKDYYICNGYIAVKVPEHIYNWNFKTEKPYFADVEPNHTIISTREGRKGLRLYDTPENMIDLQKCFPDVYKDEYEKAAYTGLKFDIKGGTCDIIAIMDDIISINTLYADAMRDAFGMADMYAKKAVAPVMYLQDDMIGLVLPFRVSEKNLLFHKNYESIHAAIIRWANRELLVY